jgi:transposase-like protein
VKRRYRNNIRVRPVKLSRAKAKCPECSEDCPRVATSTRFVRDIGTHEPILLEIIYSKHLCQKCQKSFPISMEHIAEPKSNFSNKIRDTLVYLVMEQGFSEFAALNRARHLYHVTVPKEKLSRWLEMRKRS